VPRRRPFDRTPGARGPVYPALHSHARRTYARLPGHTKNGLSLRARSYFARTHGIAKRRSARSAGRSRERPSSPRRMQRERCAAPRAREIGAIGAGGAGQRSRSSHVRLARPAPPILALHRHPSRVEPPPPTPRDESEKLFREIRYVSVPNSIVHADLCSLSKRSFVW